MYLMARRSSFFEDLATVASKLPWWMCILLALTTYLLFHTLAVRPDPYTTREIGSDLSKLAELARFGLLKQMCVFLQYVIPAAFLLGALASVIKRRRAVVNSQAPQASSDSHACPTCASPMKLRTARRGKSAGDQFYGCSRYPKCTATRPVA